MSFFGLDGTPTGWRESPLGDVSELIVRGIAPSYVADGGVLVLNQKCIRAHKVDISLARRNDHSIRRVPTERFLRVGDVLVNSTGTGTLGRVAQVRAAPEERATVDTHVTIVRPMPGVFDLSFFGYALIAIEDQLIAGGQGAVGQTELPRADIAEKFRVRFPNSLDEQKRIVAVLDQAFAALDRARANADANLADAKAVFDAHADGVFFGDSKTWNTTLLGDLADFRNGINFTKASKGRRVRMLGVKDFQDHFYAPDTGLDYVTLDREFDASDSLRRGDIVFVRSNGNPELIGRSLVVDRTSENTAHSGFTIRARLRNEEVLPDYLGHFLKSRTVRRRMTDGGSGTNIKSLNQGTLSQLLVPYPDLNQQTRIVEQLHALRDATQHLESLFTRRLTDIIKLRQSLLQAAFSGQLT